MPREMCRKDRALPNEEVLRLLNQAEYGVLSSVSSEGEPYGVPLNYCLLDGALYFHSAIAGHKVNNITANSKSVFLRSWPDANFTGKIQY